MEIFGKFKYWLLTFYYRKKWINKLKTNKKSNSSNFYFGLKANFLTVLKAIYQTLF